MRKTMGMASLAIGGMLVLAIGAHEPTGAQHGGFGLSGGGFGGVQTSDAEQPSPAPRVHVRREYSDKVLPIYAALETPISIPFENDTPLEKALEYVRQATASDAFINGIPIYVDEIGLQEAEQSLQSPVKINLDGIPLKTTLKLMLAQLDLVYDLHPDGLIEITSKHSRVGDLDPMLTILDELRALRTEVEELKQRLQVKEKE